MPPRYLRRFLGVVYMNQREMIIQYINDFGCITSYEAYIDLGITQLATRIKELKEQGYVFSYEWISKKNRYGKPIRFKKYKLEGGQSNVSNSIRGHCIHHSNNTSSTGNRYSHIVS